MNQQVNKETEKRAYGKRDIIEVSARILGHGTEAFSTSPHSTLLQLLDEGARLAGFSLLPPGECPFDRLHVLVGESVGPAIEDLNQTVGEFLRRTGSKPHFAIELVPTFRVNKRWDIAPKEELSPREILELPRIHLNHEEYTLYRPDETEALPLDTPIKVERGADFEAQRDGKYGGTESDVS